jgi:hypothetical protein
MCWTMSKESFRQFWLPKISEFEIVFAYICYYSRSMKPILYINKKIYLRVWYIFNNLLIYLARQHYRRPVPSEEDDNRIIYRNLLCQIQDVNSKWYAITREARLIYLQGERPSWKKGGMKFKTSNAHNFLIDYPIFTNKDSKCSAQWDL